jgi:hypothetical protein
VLFTYFECDVIASDADLQFLFSDDVFLWPVCVVFPFRVCFFKWGGFLDEDEKGGCKTYLIISLCSTMRFNSFTTREPTHTEMDGMDV